MHGIMTTDIATLHCNARIAAIERAEKEYKLQCDVFDTADRKAQATTTIAGALLAADLGFVAKMSDAPGLLAQTALVAITVALGVSVLMALWAMYARDSNLPASVAETEPKYAKLMNQNAPDDFKAAEAELLDFLIGELKRANASVESVSKAKATWVLRAQIALIVAAFFTILLTLGLIAKPDLLAFKATTDSLPLNASVARMTTPLRNSRPELPPSEASANKSSPRSASSGAAASLPAGIPPRK